MESEILDEIKTFEEVESRKKSKKSKDNNNEKKKVLKDFEEQERLKRLDLKTGTEKLK